MKISEFIKEDNGNYSSARLLSLLTVLLFCVDWAIHIYRSLEFNPSFTIIGLVLGVVGAKVVQKFAETKTDGNTVVNMDTEKLP